MKIGSLLWVQQGCCYISNQTFPDRRVGSGPVQSHRPRIWLTASLLSSYCSAFLQFINRPPHSLSFFYLIRLFWGSLFALKFLCSFPDLEGNIYSWEKLLFCSTWMSNWACAVRNSHSMTAVPDGFLVQLAKSGQKQILIWNADRRNEHGFHVRVDFQINGWISISN